MNNSRDEMSNQEPNQACYEKKWDEKTVEEKLQMLRQEVRYLVKKNEDLTNKVTDLLSHKHVEGCVVKNICSSYSMSDRNSDKVLE